MQLYILQFKTDPVIKIGISCSPQDRIASLGASQSIDWDNSYLVDSPNEKGIKRLERQLHGDFEEYRKDYRGITSGNTEIFKSECLVDVLKEIEHKIEFHPILKLSLQKGIEKPISVFPKKTAIQKYMSKVTGYKLYGVRECIESIIEFNDRVRLICYEHPDSKGDFNVEFRNINPSEALKYKYLRVGIEYEGTHISGAANYLLSAVYQKNTLRLEFCSPDKLSREHKYKNFKNYVLNQAKKHGIKILQSNELSPDEKAKMSIQKQLRDEELSQKTHEYAKDMVLREIRKKENISA